MILGLNIYLLARYLFRAPFGSEGWIVSFNRMEDIIGGHYYLGIMPQLLLYGILLQSLSL